MLVKIPEQVLSWGAAPGAYVAKPRLLQRFTWPPVPSPPIPSLFSSSALGKMLRRNNAWEVLKPEVKGK